MNGKNVYKTYRRWNLKKKNRGNRGNRVQKPTTYTSSLFTSWVCRDTSLFSANETHKSPWWCIVGGCTRFDENTALVHIVQCCLACLVELWIASEEQHVHWTFVGVSLKYYVYLSMFPDLMATWTVLIQKTEE